jgi:hypothetical protein
LLVLHVIHPASFSYLPGFETSLKIQGFHRKGLCYFIHYAELSVKEAQEAEIGRHFLADMRATIRFAFRSVFFRVSGTSLILLGFQIMRLLLAH